MHTNTLEAPVWETRIAAEETLAALACHHAEIEAVRQCATYAARLLSMIKCIVGRG